MSLRDARRALEPERAEADRLAVAHAALADAQERSYWLDRWQIDLNALMRRPGAARLRTAIRGARTTMRFVREMRRRANAARSPAHRRVQDPEPLVEDIAGAARFARTMPPRASAGSQVTDLLFSRLTEQDVADVEAAADATEAELLRGAGLADRRRLVLSLGVHHGLAGVLERSGLSAAAVPEGVHAMGAGPLAAGGSAYYADIVADALESAGFEFGSGIRVLDFGCSSGRVVRVLAAAHPEATWLGCDPNPEAIAWASEHLTGIEFTRSPEQPPLAYNTGALEAAYAISIWSHFAEDAAIAWLAEMHRVIRPGGLLVLSAHGYQSIAHYAQGVRGERQLNEIRSALYVHGFWFRDEFGEQRDHGVGGPDWGTSFLTPEWMAAHALPAWRMTAFAPGTLEGNQDLYVLERR